MTYEYVDVVIDSLDPIFNLIYYYKLSIELRGH